MTSLLIIIAGVLILILAALESGKSIKEPQAIAERKRRKQEFRCAEVKRKYDLFFAANGYPHRDDDIRNAAWGAQCGKTVEQARNFLFGCELNDGIGKRLDEANEDRLVKLRNHGWQAEYVALAFTPEQRTGQEFRPIHGKIWKDGENGVYFLNLVDLSAFCDGHCSKFYPLKSKSVPTETFTIEKELELKSSVITLNPAIHYQFKT